MKKIFNILFLSAVLVGATSCEKYLDINDNPNAPTEATPGLVLPQALVSTASLSVTYSNNLNDLGGQWANAGGFGGFGSTVTYAYTSGSFNGLWTSAYDNLEDYQYVINNTSSDPKLAYSTSIARIMKSFVFSKLVDQYNDVPYSEALQGATFLTPKYDKAEDIYQDLVAQINLALTDITAAQANAATLGVRAEEDPMFKGAMDNWKRFGNSLKLRLLVKMAGVPSTQAFATAQFASFDTAIGFLSDDAVVNPGYVKETGRQNPLFNSIGYDVNGTRTSTAASRMPSKWMLSFYNGVKLRDDARGKVIYRSYPNTPSNQMGDESAGVPVVPAGVSLYFTGTNASTNALGVLKGPSQGQPLMLKAESDFLRAEAFTRGYLTGNAATAFREGITASFRYLHKDVAGTVAAANDIAALVTAYETANSLSPLVNFGLATTLEQRIEAIITQKYIALNLITSDEAYNEFRRTAYPRIVNGSTDPVETFVSRQSTSTRPDRIVARVLYPQEEYNLNPANAPTGIDLFTSRIFWDLN